MRNLFSILIIIAFSTYLFSQEEEMKCLTSVVNKAMEEKNPLFKAGRAKLEDFTQKYLTKANKDEQVYIIPLVFHVVHEYGPENISKEQILDAVRILNNDFRKNNSDTTLIKSEFKGIAADSKIEFRLAQIDPYGNCTEGITRAYSTLTKSANDNVKYVDPAWPRENYFNIWVVKSVEGAAAYAYYPDYWLDPSIDGVIIDNTYVGSIGTSNIGRARVLTHEIGHSFNLAHTWGDSNDPTLPDNCLDDDGVSDTPNTIGWKTCNLNGTSCGSLDNVQNYMEYSYCCKMFTYGQKDRMRATLNSDISARDNLWQPSNLILTGTNDGYIAQVCAPIPDFNVSSSNLCNNSSIQYYDQSYNGDTSQIQRQWSFSGGNPSISTDKNPIVFYANTGTYDATLTVSNLGSSNSITKNNLVTVLNKTIGESAPFSYGFENTSFPENIFDWNKSWRISGNGSYNWERNEMASSSGSASVYIDNIYNDYGATSSLISPIITLGSNNISASLSFKLAYAPYYGSPKESLKVWVSSNCGNTWTLRYSRSSNSIVTNGGSQVNSAFIPNINEWREELVNLGSFVDSSNIRIKFDVVSNGGNYLYIDDVNISVVTDNKNIDSQDQYVDIFPNPITPESKIVFSIVRNSLVSFELFDITGRMIGSYTQKHQIGNYELNLSDIFNNLYSGAYILKSKIENQVKQFKLVKQF